MKLSRSPTWPLMNLVAGVAAMIAMVALSACSTSLGPPSGPLSDVPASVASDQPATKARPVRIAMLLPLGGFDQTAIIAKAMKQAGEMALFELNDPLVQLIVKDDKGTLEGARTATEDAIRNGAEIIIGPLFAEATSGAASVARQSNVPILSFSNDPAAAGTGVYLMSFLVQPEVDRMVTYAASQGRRRFAALIPNDAYGQTVEAAFRQAVARSGGTIVALQSYPPGANGLLEPAKLVFAAIEQADASGAPVDALFLPGGQDMLPRLGPLVAYSGIDTKRVQLIGTGGWDYPNMGRDEAFVGGWYPGPDPAGWKSFSERFSKTFGSAPPRVATLSFDAVSAAVSLSKQPIGARFTPANLTRPSGFAGVDGIVRFSAGGHSERNLAILEVQKFGPNVIDPPAGTGTGTGTVGQFTAAPPSVN